MMPKNKANKDNTHNHNSNYQQLQSQQTQHSQPRQRHFLPKVLAEKDLGIMNTSPFVPDRDEDTGRSTTTF